MPTPGEAPPAAGDRAAAERLALGRGLASLQAPPHGLLQPVAAGLLVLAVLLGPLLYKVGINDIDFKARLVEPSAAHPMGTDDLGRDMLARMLYGGRISLAVGLAAMLMAITVGVSSVPWPASRAAGSTRR